MIRAAGLPDYLCLTCIVKAFAQAGEGLTAELIGDGLDFVPIEVRIRSAEAVTARDLSEENTSLRARLRERDGEITEAEESEAQLAQAVTTLSRENRHAEQRVAGVKEQLDAIFTLANGLSTRLKDTPDMYEANKICHAVWAARAALHPR